MNKEDTVLMTNQRDVLVKFFEFLGLRMKGTNDIIFEGFNKEEIPIATLMDLGIMDSDIKIREGIYNLVKDYDKNEIKNMAAADKSLLDWFKKYATAAGIQTIDGIKAVNPETANNMMKQMYILQLKLIAIRCIELIDEEILKQAPSGMDPKAKQVVEELVKKLTEKAKAMNVMLDKKTVQDSLLSSYNKPLVIGKQSGGGVEYWKHKYEKYKTKYIINTH